MLTSMELQVVVCGYISGDRLEMYPSCSEYGATCMPRMWLPPHAAAENVVLARAPVTTSTCDIVISSTVYCSHGSPQPICRQWSLLVRVPVYQMDPHLWMWMEGPTVQDHMSHVHWNISSAMPFLGFMSRWSTWNWMSLVMERST